MNKGDADALLWLSETALKIADGLLQKGSSIVNRCASLARANDPPIKRSRDPASSTCAMLGHAIILLGARACRGSRVPLYPVFAGDAGVVLGGRDELSLLQNPDGADVVLGHEGMEWPLFDFGDEGGESSRRNAPAPELAPDPVADQSAIFGDPASDVPSYLPIADEKMCRNSIQLRLRRSFA